MGDNRTTAALAVISDLRAAERACDKDVLARAAFIGTMMEGHAQLSMQYGEAQKPLEHAVASLAALIEARGHLVQSHASLTVLARKNGLPLRMAGDSGGTHDDGEPDKPRFWTGGALSSAGATA